MGLIMLSDILGPWRSCFSFSVLCACSLQSSPSPWHMGMDTHFLEITLRSCVQYMKKLPTALNFPWCSHIVWLCPGVPENSMIWDFLSCFETTPLGLVSGELKLSHDLKKLKFPNETAPDSFSFTAWFQIYWRLRYQEQVQWMSSEQPHLWTSSSGMHQWTWVGWAWVGYA